MFGTSNFLMDQSWRNLSMRESWVMCVLLGALAWGQAAPATPPAGRPSAPGAPSKQEAAETNDTAASVPADAAVITVKGVCPAQPKTAATKAGAAKTDGASAKTAAADCKTVITKAEFERLASGVAPNLTPQLKKQLATVLPRLIAMSAEAQKKGLDKNPRYLETVKFAKMQILTQELQRTTQEEAAKIPDADIAEYYKKNPEAYEQYNLDRLFVPRSKQPDAAETKDNDKDEKLTEEQQKAKDEQEKRKQAEGEEEMTQMAEKLRARAAAGEDIAKLQKEAFEAAGMKIDSPTVNLPTVRRTGLPPGHTAVFDLKAGDVSQLINDSGGHYVYKVNKKETLPLDQVKSEIHSTRQNQRMRDAMETYQNSFKAETNEAYFGPVGAQAPPSPRGGMMHPKMPPSPTTPAAQPQGQPPASSPSEAPKPN